MNRRMNLEMSDFPSDRAIALLMWAACLAILIFTGAGPLIWRGLADTIAAWWLL